MIELDKQSARWHSENNRLFIVACAIAGTPATRRQYSKYRNGYGKAFAAKNAAKLQLEQEGKDVRTA